MPLSGSGRSDYSDHVYPAGPLKGQVMPDPAQSAVTALTGATTETVGRFSYEVPTDTWWWSTSLYCIHGFAHGEVVPTTALMMVVSFS